MSSKVVLLDLENNMPTATLLREIVEHHPSVYLFNCAGKFEYSLQDLTEFAGWVSTGQLIILDSPRAEFKEFEYAVVVGQLMALLEPDTQVEVISAADSIQILLEMLQASEIACHLIHIQPEAQAAKSKHHLPSPAAIRSKPELLLVKKYCDALAKMSGKPTTQDALKNSISNILQLETDKAQHVLGMLINLKIVKRVDEQISFRKKVLKQWVQLDLDAAVEPVQEMTVRSTLAEQAEAAELHPQHALFKNFSQIDPVQWEVAKKLRELKGDKPKDIYELRDLLERLFPKSDIRLLLKELIEKGYIYWNGHEVLYSHEMFLS
ncbi:hypothetical protein [Acinetobacter towneri]|uniref:PIN-like domain-containing protein n=1 Tax=Acinetobacter towneri TaxID=202956 RepID=A0AAP9GVH9_9GAMM|nr:hypothetical protein [Acinetobacter towneri]QGM28413.1 hypothetical protein GJD93_12355 [Acinetobacter towneri]